MKNLLAKFFQSLACRIVLATVATATVANAHDLPVHFPLAPTDWGMIQQDCFGHQRLGIDVGPSSIAPSSDYFVAQPDAGNPPAPDAPVKGDLADYIIAQPDGGSAPAPSALVSGDREASHELVGPTAYDGVDCAQLEYLYRNGPSGELVESRQESAPQFTATPSPTLATEAEFDKSFYAACSCEFESRQSNQSILPPTFTLKRTYIEDYFANQTNQLKPLMLRDCNGSQFTGNSFDSLALAIPTVQVQNQYLLADVLSEFASFDCVARSEFYSSYRAFQLGELAGTLAMTWFADTLPSASQAIVKFAENLEPANQATVPAPMFVIYRTAAGSELAIPIAQARDWEQPAAPLASKVATSKEFQDLVDSTNARLHWAGGRMSAAASYMNEWLSDRLARAKSSELR